MSAYTNHGKTTSAKRNSGRKETLTERYRRILRRISSKNHSTTVAQVTAELNIHLEGLISTKPVRFEFHKSNIYGRTAIAKPPISESNAQMVKRCCHECKAWISDNWERASDIVRWVVLRVVPYIRKSLRLENTQGSLRTRSAWYQQWNMGEVLWWFGQK
jgi:hypothetical protein